MLPRVRVRLLGVPVALFCAAEQHTNDVLREVALMAAARPALGDGQQFSDLLGTAEEYTHRPAFASRRMSEAVVTALRAGWDTVDVDLDADDGAAERVVAWESLLRRFDDMSRAEELLTLPSSPEVAAFRAWYVREVVEQVRTGRAPVPWTAARSGRLAGVS